MQLLNYKSLTNPERKSKMQTLKITSVTENATFLGRVTPSLSKSEIKKMAIDGIRSSKEYLLNTEGFEGASCSGSYDLGYYEGLLRCLELLNKRK